MKFSIKNGFFVPGPSLAAEKQGLGLKFSIENESALPNISTSFPPKTLKMGTPKSEIGMGQEIPGNSGFL